VNRFASFVIRVREKKMRKSAATRSTESTLHHAPRLTRNERNVSIILRQAQISSYKCSFAAFNVPAPSSQGGESRSIAFGPVPQVLTQPSLDAEPSTVDQHLDFHIPMLSVPFSRPRQCGLGTLWLVVHLRLRLLLRLLPLLPLLLLPLLLLLLLLPLLLPPLLPLLLPELLFDTALHLPFRWPSPTLSRLPPC